MLSLDCCLPNCYKRLNRAGSPTKSTSQMTVDVRRLSDQIADINRQLDGRELGGKDFDEFTKQEDILKVGEKTN